MKLLIDGDIIAYQSASVGDGHKWKASNGHVERYKKDMVDYCAVNKLDVKDLTEVWEPEPIENVLHTVRLMLENGIFEAFPTVDSFRIYLTGKDNYRNDVATILPYKGNRAGTRKPHWLAKCREYLVEQWHAKVIEGQEADDILGIEQTEETCICSLDKDLDMIPGNHFNWTTQQKYYVSEIEASYNFYKQLIIGDSTDNILCLYGVGKSSKLLKDMKKFNDPYSMYSLVREQYDKRFGSYAEQFLTENARLLWIRRNHDELWEIPQVEHSESETSP